MIKMLLLTIAVSLVVLWAVSCGGGAYGNPAGPSPSPTPSPAPAAQGQPAPSATVNIVSSTGSGAFTPNPVQVPSGGTILWMNATNVTHVLVMNDGTAIGTLTPGSSVTKTLSGSGGNYHCTTHPSMVGSINGAQPPQPPPGSTSDY